MQIYANLIIDNTIFHIAINNPNAMMIVPTLAFNNSNYFLCWCWIFPLGAAPTGMSHFCCSLADVWCWLNVWP